MNKFEEFVKSGRDAMGFKSRLDGASAVQAQQVPGKFVILPEGTIGGLELHTRDEDGMQRHSFHGKIILPNAFEAVPHQIDFAKSGAGMAEFALTSERKRELDAREKTGRSDQEDGVTLVSFREQEKYEGKADPLLTLIAEEDARLAREIAIANERRIEGRGIDIDEIAFATFRTMLSGRRTKFFDIRHGANDGKLPIRTNEYFQLEEAIQKDQPQSTEVIDTAAEKVRKIQENQTTEEFAGKSSTITNDSEKVWGMGYLYSVPDLVEPVDLDKLDIDWAGKNDTDGPNKTL